MTAAGEQTQLQVGLVDITQPTEIDGETREVSIGHHVVIVVGKESAVLTPDIADQVAERLTMCAKEARRGMS